MPSHDLLLRSSFVAFCVLWGFISGGLRTAPAVVVAHPVLSPSMSLIGTRSGMSLTIVAVGTLIGTRIAGAMVGADMAHFLPAQTLAGATMAAGALCMILRARTPTKEQGGRDSIRKCEHKLVMFQVDNCFF